MKPIITKTRAFQQALAMLALAGTTVAAHAATYLSEVLADSPTGYWRMNETSGSTLVAQMGTNGTYVGGVMLGQPGAVITDGVSNFGAGFNGSDAYGSAALTNLGASFTIEMWMKSNTPTWNTYWGQASRQANGFFLNGYAGGTTVYFELLDSTIFQYGNVGYNVTADITQWHHYVGTYDNATDTARLYFDGQLVGTNPNVFSSGTRTESAIGLILGAEPANFRYGNGMLDEVAVYSSVLSDARIQTHYLAAGPPAAVPEPGRALLLLFGTIIGMTRRRR